MAIVEKDIQLLNNKNILFGLINKFNAIKMFYYKQNLIIITNYLFFIKTPLTIFLKVKNS